MTNSRRTLGLLVGVGALAIGLALAWTELRAPPAEHVDPGARAVAPTPATSAAELETPNSADPTDGPKSETRALAATDPVATAIPADALWVEGRVTFPDGTPADERAVVIAHGRRYAGSEDHRFEVAADGRFRAAFAPETVKGGLAVVGRYVFSRRPESIDPRVPLTDLQLEVELGGCLRVHVRPSAMAAQRGFDPARARVQTNRSYYERTAWWSLRDGTPDANGVVELGGLDDEDPGVLLLRLSGFAAPDAESVAVEAGRVLDVTIEAIVAPRFSGVVRDAAGERVPRAVIYAVTEVGPDLPLGGTDEHGRFDLQADELGEVELRATAPGSLGGGAGPWETAEGSERADIVIVLDPGLAIGGVVRWPDGTAAAGAAVSIATPDSNSPDASATADAEGRFRFGGLEEGAFAVAASAAPPTAAATPSTETAAWTARHASVAAGTADVVLELAAGSALRGRVVDDLGAAVVHAWVDVVPAGDDTTARKSVGWKPVGDDGSFELAGVPAGEWRLRAWRSGDTPQERFTLTLPADAEWLLEAVLPRPVTIAGRVIDSAGAPIASAVIVTATDNDTRHAVRTKTQPDGTFRLERVHAGEVDVHVSRAGHAATEVTLPLEPGAAHANLEIVLLPSARIEGIVRDSENRPWADVELSCDSEEGVWQDVTTDARGEFRLEVEPGRTTLRLTGVGNALTVPAPVTVDAIAGQVVRVELGGPPQGSLRLGGVLRAGAPVNGVRLEFFFRQGLSGEQVKRRAITDAGGRYEVLLPGPGRVGVSVMFSETLTAFTMAQLAPADTALDLEVGAASIRGRVVGGDGRPLEDVRVTLESERVEPIPAGAWFAYAWASSGRDGSFSFLSLPPSTYRIVASGVPAAKGRAALSDAVVAGLVVARDAHVDGVELQLARGGSLVVNVTGPDGEPAEDVEVRVARTGHDPENRTTDDHGVARFDDVTAGLVTIRAARTAGTDLVEREPVSATVASGATTTKQLELVPGGSIHVRAVDRAGEDLPIDGMEGIWIEDAAGVRWDGEGDFRSDAGQGSFGPLRPGAYVVRAFLAGVIVSVPAQVEAGRESKVVVREPE